MDGSSRNGWVMKRDEHRSHGSSSSSVSYLEEDRQLELRLGPPGDHTTKNNFRERDHDSSLLSLGYFSSSASITPNNNHNNNNNNGGGQRPINNGTTHWSYHHHLHQFPSSTNIHQSLPVMTKESSSSQTCSTKITELQNAEKKQFSPSSAPNTAVPNNTSQKRTAPAPVVGWPPIRSFRKNLTSNTSSTTYPKPESQNVGPSKVMEKPPPAPVPPQPVENRAKGLFVKINMDGVPIGRKVDLKAYDSYEKLSSAVDQLFRALLAAQRDSSVGGIQNKQDEEKPITGLLDGSGEYTLVYEDNEGDCMLVGDVPWHMFVSTVKRLRVLKSSELSVLNLGNKQGKIST